MTNYSTLSPADRELVPTEKDLSRIVQDAIDHVGHRDTAPEPDDGLR
ncbi:hypothetical protein [Streptomyces sp. NPDC088350]